MTTTTQIPAEHQEFIDDMEEAGLEVEHYHGRSWWHGPAVRVDDLQDAMSWTKVPVQWDSMGLGYIVYPRRNESGGVLDCEKE